jgi:hypothetical protein
MFRYANVIEPQRRCLLLLQSNVPLYILLREKFMRDLERNFGEEGVYAGETLLPLRPPQSTLLKFQKKRGEENELLVSYICLCVFNSPLHTGP